MALIKEFKEFALKDNVIELAVAVIIGAAFGSIVSSMVDDIITPLILNPALEATGAENIAQLSWKGVKYGNFVAAVIKFLTIAFVLFMIIRTMRGLKKKEMDESVKSADTQTD